MDTMYANKTYIIGFIALLIILCIIYCVTTHEGFDINEGKFNVIENRNSYPLKNLAGDSWTVDEARPFFYSSPDGIMTGIPIPPTDTRQNLYEKQIYEGTFEIPPFNRYENPVPIDDSESMGIQDISRGNLPFYDDEVGPFCCGVSNKRMSRSDYQEKNDALPRALQHQVDMESLDPKIRAEIEMELRGASGNEHFSAEHVTVPEEMMKPQEMMIPKGIEFSASGNTTVFCAFIIIIIMLLMYVIFYK